MTILALSAEKTGSAELPQLEAIQAAIRPGFLVECGWDAVSGVLSPPRDHPLLGLRKCARQGCLAGVRSHHVELCKTCEAKHRSSDMSLAEFMLDTSATRRSNRGERLCIVPRCERPSHTYETLCSTHCTARMLHRDLSASEWIRQEQPTPLPSHGPCRVAGCIRVAAMRVGLCTPHGTRWGVDRRLGLSSRDKDALAKWITQQQPIGVDHLVILTGLPDRLIAEILLGLQHRCDQGTRTPLTVLRAMVSAARAAGVNNLLDLSHVKTTRKRQDAEALARSLATSVRRAMATPESEFALDVWDLATFGARGMLDFTAISQAWLRDAAKHWAAEDLPLHRGRQSGATAKGVIGALIYLSESLRSTREDHGEDPAQLGRRDIVNFSNRLKHFEHTGSMTAPTRLRTIRWVRRALDDARGYHTASGGVLLADLPHDFKVTRADVPAEPARDEPGRDVPPSVLRTIADNLHVLQGRSGRSERVVAELLIETGRRPDEICALRYDCLRQDAQGKYVLVYDNSKANRLERRLPIGDATAQLIRGQQEHVRATYPATSLEQVALFPRDYRNRDGKRSLTAVSFGDAHRKFIDLIADQLCDADGSPYPAREVVPYSYRHSYAQRHADAGTAPDVLRDLMDHRSINTTMGYYRVTEKRIRGAVDMVATHQFDGQARPVLGAVGGLLSHEHARLRVGQVAVPFGTCTEPSNVKAGGHACPFKYTCVGCGHFRSDASYLPELKAYLQQLLADRERLLAAGELQDWARRKVIPADEEITQLRGLIRRIEADLQDLPEADRATIEDAVAVVRAARATVSLGMPQVRPTSTSKEGHR